MEAIKQFFDAYAFLSNFYNAPVSYNGLIYQNSEAAFQAQKEIRDEDRKKIYENESLSSKTCW